MHFYGKNSQKHIDSIPFSLGFSQKSLIFFDFDWAPGNSSILPWLRVRARQTFPPSTGKTPTGSTQFSFIFPTRKRDFFDFDHGSGTLKIILTEISET